MNVAAVPEAMVWEVGPVAVRVKSAGVVMGVVTVRVAGVVVLGWKLGSPV